MERKLQVKTIMDGVDDENWPFENETKTAEYSRATVLSGRQSQDLMEMDMRWGGECRAELNLTGRIVDDGDIMLDGDLKLYEGTTESTTDLDGQQTISFLVPANNRGSESVTTRNQDEGGDSVTAHINAYNMEPDQSA